MTTNEAMTVDNLDFSIPEVWANMALGYLPKNLNLLNTVTVDFDANEIKSYGDKVNITKRGTLVANDKVKGNNVTLQTPSDAQVSVTLNKHKEITFSTEDVARIMAKPNTIEGYMTDASLVIAETVEKALAELYASAGNEVNIGSLSGESLDTIAKLREARRKLITGKLPENAPVYGYVSEYLIEKLPLTDASKLGNPLAVVEGSIGKLGGVSLFEAQGVEVEGSPATYHNMIYGKDAMALVVRPLPMDAERFGGAKQAVVNDAQTGLSIRVTMSYNANALAPQVTLDVLFGVGILRAEHLVDAYFTL